MAVGDWRCVFGQTDGRAWNAAVLYSEALKFSVALGGDSDGGWVTCLDGQDPYLLRPDGTRRRMPWFVEGIYASRSNLQCQLQAGGAFRLRPWEVSRCTDGAIRVGHQKYGEVLLLGRDSLRHMGARMLVEGATVPSEEETTDVPAPPPPHTAVPGDWRCVAGRTDGRAFWAMMLCSEALDTAVALCGDSGDSGWYVCQRAGETNLVRLDGSQRRVPWPVEQMYKKRAEWKCEFQTDGISDVSPWHVSVDSSAICVKHDKHGEVVKLTADGVEHVGVVRKPCRYGCGLISPDRASEAAHAEECEARPVDCPWDPSHCQWRGQAREQGEHATSCKRRPTRCLYGCTKLVPFEELVPHCGDCERMPVPVISPDDLELGKVIGAGSFGTVKLGKYRGGVVVAVKQSMAVITDMGFVNELKVLQKLFQLRGTCEDAYRAVGIFGVVLSPLSLVLEHMPHGNLREYLRRRKGQLYDQDKLLAALDTATGLAFLHEHETLHNDLKSANILLDHNCRCVLCDFGLSQGALYHLTSAAQQTTRRENLGTLHYLAPERLTLSPKKTYKSDVYGLAVVMWELLTLEEPYAEVDPAVVRDAVKKGERLEIPPDSTPSVLASAVPLCWAQEPDRRPTAREVVNQLGEHVRTFRSSRFKQLYRSVEHKCCETSLEVTAVVHKFLLGRARDKKVDSDRVDIFVQDVETRLKDKVKEKGWSETATDWAGYWWTTLQQVGPGGFHWWLNDALRADEDGPTAELMAIFARTLNRKLVQRGLSSIWPKDKSGQPVQQAFRGCGIPDTQWSFFHPGRRYRVPFYLATSLRLETAELFATQCQSEHKVLFEVHFMAPVTGTDLLCSHVALLEKSMVDDEAEFLFVPYSIFEVVAAETRNRKFWGDYLHVHIRAERDNQCLSAEGLPLAQWH